MAALLLGVPTSGSYAITLLTLYRSSTWRSLLQDDWRVSSKLTINAGPSLGL